MRRRSLEHRHAYRTWLIDPSSIGSADASGCPQEPGSFGDPGEFVQITGRLEQPATLEVELVRP